MLSENIILQSAGSLSVAVMALLMLILQTLFFFRKLQFTWYAWSAAISFSALLYSVGIFLEYNTPAGPLNRFSGLLEYTAIICLVHCLYGFTFSYLGIESKRYHPIAGVCHGLILILLWSTHYIVAESFTTRDFIGLEFPFIEPALGPLGPVFVFYAAISGVIAMTFWIKHKRTDPKHRIIFLTGMGFWLLLGIHDGLASLGLPALQYFMEYGFLGFAMVVLWVVFNSYLEIAAEEKYRVITEFANDCILVIQDEKMVFGNPACCDLIGAPIFDLKPRDFRDIMPSEDRKTVLDHYKTLLEGGHASNPHTVRIGRTDGEQRFVEIASSLIQYRNRPAVLAIMRDITKRKRVEEKLAEHRNNLEEIVKERTAELEDANLRLRREISERKQAEEALRTSQEIYRNIIYESPIGISIYDASGQCVEANDSIARIVGATREKVLQQNYNSIESWKQSGFLEKAKSAVEDQCIKRHDLAVESTFGKGVKLDAYLVPFSAGGLLLMVIDITDRLRAEEALRESEEKFRNISESSFDMIFTTDKEGFITYVSPSASRILLYEPDAVKGKHFSTFLMESEIPLVSKLFDQMLRGEEVGSFQMEIVRNDGSKVSVELSGSRILKQGEVIGTQGIIRDIGERYKLEEERLKREKLESLGILAAGLAHNFNNILTVIMGNVYFAKQDMDRDSEAYEVLQEAEKQTTKATNLTQQLLTFAKGGAPVKKTASLAEVIRESGNFVLKGSKVRCDVIILEDIWLSEIDVGQISQVIQNLIINADQATPEGGVIKIEIENRVIEAKDVLPIPSGKYVHVSVSDEGGGIQKKHLPKIFDPYFSTKKMGSGLGLATAHSIIKKHGGHITVDSEFGVGTVFHFYLPASEGEMVATKGVKEGLIKGGGKVLIMDDEESFRHMVCQVLGKLGYKVDMAKDGEEAVEKYMRAMKEDEPFDAVILDLIIPGGLGGKETIRKLKEIDPEVKAVVASGYSHDPVMANFRDYGFIGVLPKPFGIDKLGRVLHDIILGEDS